MTAPAYAEQAPQKTPAGKPAKTANSSGQLQQYVAELQKKPDDQALREKIIKLALTLKPKPAIPEEARRHFVRGNTALKDAKDASDYDRAIARYNDALLVAPWWPEPYFNLAKALELRESYDQAIAALKLYLLAAPQAEDARAAQDMIYALQDKKERTTSVGVKAALAKKKEEEFFKRLDGAKFVTAHDERLPNDEIFFTFDATLTIRGNEVVFDDILTGGDSDHIRRNRYRIGEPHQPGYRSARFRLNGREFDFTAIDCQCNEASCKGVISEDGSRITITNPHADKFLKMRPRWGRMCWNNPIVFPRK
jgi:tetratricopeptide (TPR) repeat protein